MKQIRSMICSNSTPRNMIDNIISSATREIVSCSAEDEVWESIWNTFYFTIYPATSFTTCDVIRDVIYEPDSLY